MRRPSIAVPTSRGYWARRLSRASLRLKAGPIFPLFTGLLTLVIVGGLLWSGSATPGAIVAILVQGSTTAAALYWQAYVLRSSLSLVTIASAFISESPHESLDRMLGTLMGMAKEADDVGDPAAPLFELIMSALPGSEFEFRRRVAEALPVLAILNPGRSFEIAEELRTDSDPRWVSDVRRRVIESLYLPVAGHRPFARELTRAQRDDLLAPRANDTIYVAFAIVECAYAPMGKAMNRERTQKIVNSMSRFAEHHFTREQREALLSQIAFWKHVDNREISSAEELLEELMQSSNQFAAVAGARAAVTWGRLSRTTRLEAIRRIHGSSNKMVRRVSAREVSLRFLVECLDGRSSFTREAQQLLREIASDADDIIRTTMLDIVEFGLRNADGPRTEICDILESMDTAGTLHARIARARGAT